MSDFIIYLKKESKRKVKMEKLTFFLAGFIFLLGVFDNLSLRTNGLDNLDYIFNGAMLLAGVINIGFGVVYGKMKDDSKKDFITRALFILTGAILIIDGLHKILLHYNAMQYFLIAPGILYISLGVFYKQLQKIRSVKLNKEGISWRTSPFVKHSFLWNEISSLYLEEKQMTITLLNKKNYKINLSSIKDDDHDELVKKVKGFSNLSGGSELTSSQLFMN